MTAATASAPAAHPLLAVDLPVRTFEDAAPHLRRPFTRAAVKFKVQAVWPKDAPTGALIVCYIDSRLVVERLNTVCPQIWSERFELVGKSLWCHMTVDGITRSDIGDGYVGKGLVSDARKRAAVQFGVGVSLYATQAIRLKKGAHLKDCRTAKGPSLELTPQGEGHCRELYGNWLAAYGEIAFGPVLDHGDVEDSQGDPEQEATSVERPTSSPAPVPEPTLSPSDAATLLLNAESAGVDRDTLRKAAQFIAGLELAAFDDDAAALVALARLTVEQGVRLGAWIEKKRAEIAQPAETPETAGSPA